MAEYKNVENPFLEKLKQLNWDVTDQGSFGIPQDPKKSLRTSFREVTLKETFKSGISNINTSNNVEWLTDKQLEDLYQEITIHEKSNRSLLEVNKAKFEQLSGKTKTIIAENETTGDKNVAIKIIDFENWKKNKFTAINQFRVVTPCWSMRRNYS
jgi:type I restriction enzyme R subunit